MMNLGFLSNKKKRLVCTAFLTLLAISTTSAVLATWTLYKNCLDASSVVNVSHADRIVTNDGSGAYITFFFGVGEVATDGYSFGVGEVEVKQVKVSLKAKTNYGFGEFKAKVYLGGNFLGESGWKNINVGTYQYKYVYVNIIDTNCDPDDFTINIRVAKTLNYVYMDHVRAKVEY